MGQRIGVAKVAKLLGIKRGDLNKRLQAADIPTFEGEVDYEKVRCIAPSLNFGDPAVRRAQYMREDTSKTFHKDQATLEREALEHEVKHLTTELMVASREADYFQDILQEMADRLGEVQMGERGERQALAFELCGWLRNRIASSDAEA